METNQEQIDLSVAIIKRAPAVFAEAPAILEKAKKSSSAAIMAAQALLDRMLAEGTLNSELDQEANNLLVKIGKTVVRMKEDRGPVTQIFDEFKSFFTAEENRLDIKKAGTLPALIQEQRNKYAAELQAREKQRIEAEKRKTQILTQRADLAEWINKMISHLLNTSLAERIKALQKAFDEITLENFSVKYAGIQALNTAFPKEKLAAVIRYDIPRMNFPHLDDTAINTVQTEAHTAYDFNQFYITYSDGIAALKDKFLEQRTGLKQELETMAAAAKANDQAENDRLEEMRQARIKAENQRLADEQAARQKAEDLKQEQAAAAAKATLLFESVAEQAEVVTDAPETRTGFEIQVVNNVGWTEIFQFFYLRNSALSIEDMGKKTLNQMKKFAEDMAKKDGEKITSKHLVYKETVKAVNRKA